MNSQKGKLSPKGMVLVNLIRLLLLGCLLFAGYGAVKLYFYTNPMVEKRFADAVSAPVGDKITAMYGEAVRVFHDERINPEWRSRQAKQILTEAFNQMTKQTGMVPPDRKEFASKVQHMLGVVNESQEQYRLAISAYEESLKSNPQNMESKFNLERLKKKFPDLVDDTKPQQGGDAPGDKDKGI